MTFLSKKIRVKKIVGITFLLLSFIHITSQTVITITIKDPPPGLCDVNSIYSLYAPFGNQVEAKSSSAKSEIQNLLNSKLKILKEDLKYKDKGTVTLLINCKGEVLRCTCKTHKKNEKMERELSSFFNTLSGWTAGTYHKKAVDSELCYTFKIKKGAISIY